VGVDFYCFKHEQIREEQSSMSLCIRKVLITETGEYNEYLDEIQWPRDHSTRYLVHSILFSDIET